MNRLKQFLKRLRPARRCSGDLTDAILHIYENAGAQFHADFHRFPIITEWRSREDEDPEYTKHLFFTAQANMSKIEELLTNLYREPAVTNAQGALFMVAGQPQAPMAVIGVINKDTTFIQIVLKHMNK